MLTINTDQQRVEPTLEQLATRMFAILTGNIVERNEITNSIINANLDRQRSIITYLLNMPPPPGFLEVARRFASFQDAPTYEYQRIIKPFLFWWGYQVIIPPHTVQKIVDTTNRTSAIAEEMNTIAERSPILFPFVSALGRMIEQDILALQNKDGEERALTISALWILPTDFIPDHVPITPAATLFTESP